MKEGLNVLRSIITVIVVVVVVVVVVVNSAAVIAHCGCIAAVVDAKLPAVRQVKSLAGIGIEGWVDVSDDDEDGDYEPVCVGNERMLQPHGGNVRVTPLQEEVHRLCTEEVFVGCTVLLVSVSDEVKLLLALSGSIIIIIVIVYGYAHDLQCQWV